jgi:hypothetical protein
MTTLHRLMQRRAASLEAQPPPESALVIRKIKARLLRPPSAPLVREVRLLLRRTHRVLFCRRMPRTKMMIST